MPSIDPHGRPMGFALAARVIVTPVQTWWHLPAADQGHLRDHVMRGTKGTGHDPPRAGPREAGDAVDACGRKGF
jgi:hypothetical protein